MKNIIKNENGSITLFVLVSMLFMTMFLITIYTLSTNNEIAAKNATKKIKEKYEMGLDRIDEIYEELQEKSQEVRAFDKDGNEIVGFNGEEWKIVDIVETDEVDRYKIEYTGTGTVEKVPYYIREENKNKEGYVVAYIEPSTETTGKKILVKNVELKTVSSINTFLTSDTTDTIITELEFGENITLGFTNMNSFFRNSKLEKIDMGNLDTSNVKHMSGLFWDCKNLQEIIFGENFNTSNVEGMYYMFRECRSLKKLDISMFDTSKVKAMDYMFAGCVNLEEIIFDKNKFNTQNVTNMSCMFNNCALLEKLDVTGFNTSKTTNMNAMFSGCKKLSSLGKGLIKDENGNDVEIEIGVKNFNTSNVTNMASMFQECESLNEIDVTGFETAGVTSMASMFCRCKSLKELDVTRFDTSKTTNMRQMFQECSSLTTLGKLKDENGNEVKDEAGNTIEVGVKNFNTASLAKTYVSGSTGNLSDNISYMYYMFHGCSKLEKIILGEKFKLTEPVVVILTSKYSLDDDGNKVGGTETQMNAIHNMFGGTNNLIAIEVADPTTKQLLIDNSSVIGITNTSIIKDLTT